MAGDDLAEVVAAMSRPGFYPHPVGEVEHVETHISHVFLAGERAYKIKKAVNLGFLDFAGLEDRVHYTREELTLNRRLAPELYLEAAGIRRGPQGLALAGLEDGPGQLVEPVLVMRRMDENRRMDRLLDRGEVGAEDVRGLGRLLARFYATARRGAEVARFGGWRQVSFNVEENFHQTQDYQEVTVSPARWAAIHDYSLGFLRANRELFRQRVAQGHVVDGHGDLHSGNINLPADGPPIVFDCIEFNQRFRYQDAACDLAFLAMDLDYHGRPDLAHELVAAYVEASGDQGLHRLLDFYKCYRAVVRAKVYGFELDDAGIDPSQKFTDLAKARAYFRLAAGYAGGEPPYLLVCFMGLMAAGKSWLAKETARRRGWIRLSSDQMRKRMAGRDPEAQAGEAFGQGIYAPDMSQRVYRELMEVAGVRLALGDSVVVDASFMQDGWRREFLALGQRHGARVVMVEVASSREVRLERLVRREAKGKSESEGRRALMDDQARAWEDFSPETRAARVLVDGGAAEDDKLGRVAAAIDLAG